ATINDVTGATANLAATVSGEWVVVARSVSRAEKRSLDGDAGTVEVKLVDIDGAIDDVQDSANGKNKVTYSDRPPTENDPGIFDDTWFVGQVGRPNDIVEATNAAFNGSFEAEGPLAEGLTLSGDGSTLSYDTSWHTSGSRSLRIVPSAHWSTASATAPVGGFFKPGEQYTIAGDFRLLSSQSGTINSDWARRIRIRFATPGGSVDVYTQASPNAAGVHRHVLTFTVPNTATSLNLRLGNGSTATTAWWDSITIEEGSTSGAYFDGDTEDGATDNESHYRWTGTPHASTSEKYLPALNIGDSDNWNVIEQYRHDGTGWVKVELSHY